MRVARLLSLLLLVAPPVQAATLTLTLPDDQLQTLVRKFCQWHPCACGPSESEVQRVLEQAMTVVSLGHVRTLAGLGAELTVRWDEGLTQ